MHTATNGGIVVVSTPATLEIRQAVSADCVTRTVVTLRGRTHVIYPLDTLQHEFNNVHSHTKPDLVCE